MATHAAVKGVGLNRPLHCFKGGIPAALHPLARKLESKVTNLQNGRHQAVRYL